MRHAALLACLSALFACGPAPPPAASPPAPAPRAELPAHPAVDHEPAGAEEPTRAVFKVGELDEAPSVQSREEPDFSGIEAEARTARNHFVAAEVVIDEWGNVESARVTISSGNSAVDEAVLQAARRWTFEPGVKDRVPVAVSYPLTVKFTPPPADREPGE